MNRGLGELFQQLPDLLAGHMLLSSLALLVAVAVAVPLGVGARRSPRFGAPVLALAGLIQTIPALALLALMVPLLGGRIGFLPAFLALTLYGLLPVLRNTVTGLAGVDGAAVEAARAVGMTRNQRLLTVELPLALPVIIAGIRTATVWVVGMATLSTPVGAPSLGNYIFAGLQTRNTLAVLFGCFFAAGLAIILDRLIRLLETALRERRRGLLAAAGVGLGLVLAGGLWPLVAAPHGHGVPEIAQPQAPLGGQTFRIGAKPFTEQYILARVLAGRLKDQGAETKTLEGMGSTVLFDALAAGSVDMYVDYTGTLWANIMQEIEPVGRDEMFRRVSFYLQQHYGIRVAGRLGFENAYGLAMTRARAARLSIRSIADLSPIAAGLTAAGDPEFFARPEWRRVRDMYGLAAMATRTMDSTFMYGAVRDDQVDLIGAYTTDGRIAAYDLVLLSDPEQALPPYDAIVLLSPAVAQNQALDAALAPLMGRLGGDLMRQANRMVDLDGRTPAQAAAYLRSLNPGKE